MHAYAHARAYKPTHAAINHCCMLCLVMHECIYGIMRRAYMECSMALIESCHEYTHAHACTYNCSTYTRRNAFIPIWIYASQYIYIYRSFYLQPKTSAHTCIHTCMHIMLTNTWPHACTYICLFIRIDSPAHLSFCTSVEQDRCVYK